MERHRPGSGAARDETVDPGSDIQDVWARARAAARSRGEALGSVHLLGALAEDPGPAARLLSAHGIDGTWIRLRAAGLPAERESALGHLEATAGRLAESLRARRPGPVHLLAAILGLPEASALALLRRGGIDIEKLIASVHGFLSGSARYRSRAVARGAATAGTGRIVPAAPRRTEGRDAASGPGPAAAAAADPAAVPVAGAQPLARPLRPLRPREAATSLRRAVAAANGPRGAAPAGSKASPSTASDKRLPGVGARMVTGSLRGRSPCSSAANREPSTVNRLGPWLAAHARDLRREAAEGRLDPAVARDDVVGRLLDVLQKRRASSPCLAGPSGVGKTAVVHALAHHLARTPAAGLVLLEVPPGAVVSGSDLRGSLAERLRQIAGEAGAVDGRVVLCVGDLAQFVRAVAEGGEGADQALREALESRAFALLGEADAAAWDRAARGAPAVARCITVVDVPEPDDAGAARMIAAVLPRYAEHHGVAIRDDAVDAAVRIARRYLVGRALPDKALQLVDLAAAHARRAGGGEASAREVAEVAAEMVDVPADRLLAADGRRFLELEAELGRRIVGHREALERIADVLRRNAAGFRERRPIGSFLFLGPTGVGKTETARAMAECLFPGRENLLRLDMSEYAEPHSVARLVGAPPGYVGFEAGGMLAEALRRRPYQVVLLDEFEKAHADVHRLFLQVLEDGRLTDGRGQLIDFRNAVVVMTSNIGSELFVERRAVGFGRETAGPGGGEVLAAARRALPPELWNRIDETLVFQPLAADEIRRIARLLLDRTFAAATAGREVTVWGGDELVEHLVAAGGYDPAMGARPMRRAIQRLVEAPLARALLRPDLPRGACLRVDVRGGAVAVTETAPAGAEAVRA